MSFIHSFLYLFFVHPQSFLNSSVAAVQQLNESVQRECSAGHMVKWANETPNVMLQSDNAPSRKYFINLIEMYEAQLLHNAGQLQELEVGLVMCGRDHITGWLIETEDKFVVVCYI